MSLNNYLHVKYVGKDKIKAIKSVRYVFGIGLKEAKDAVESGDMKMRGRSLLALRKEYSREVANLGDILAEALDSDPPSGKDWQVFTPTSAYVLE